jgi:hypothetical protein
MQFVACPSCGSTHTHILNVGRNLKKDFDKFGMLFAHVECMVCDCFFDSYKHEIVVQQESKLKELAERHLIAECEVANPSKLDIEEHIVAGATFYGSKLKLLEALRFQYPEEA